MLPGFPNVVKTRFGRTPKRPGPRDSQEHGVLRPPPTRRDEAPLFEPAFHAGTGGGIRDHSSCLTLGTATMIISQTPYRVSFAGGGTDLPAFCDRNTVPS